MGTGTPNKNRKPLPSHHYRKIAVPVPTSRDHGDKTNTPPISSLGTGTATEVNRRFGKNGQIAFGFLSPPKEIIATNDIV